MCRKIDPSTTEDANLKVDSFTEIYVDSQWYNIWCMKSRFSEFYEVAQMWKKQKEKRQEKEEWKSNF